MGRRINISQPTVINTELVPLTDSFALEPNGQTEQWYYENDGTYAPDRRIVPLVITPKLSAFDKDTNQTYTPNISTIAWYASRWTNGKWVEAEITNISDASQDYYIRQDKALQVSKNLSDAAHGVTIRCIATFIDPRDAGITYTEEDTIQLTANKDATVFYPEVDILNETTVTFNPLIDENSHKVFKGKIDWTSITRLNPDIAEYYANPSGTEQMLPDNATDVTSLSPILDIRYGRESVVSFNQLFTYRQTANGTIAGNERTLTWNQLIQNGDFSNGLTGWDGYPEPYVDETGMVVLTINDEDTSSLIQSLSHSVQGGHKYYCSCYCLSEDEDRILIISGSEISAHNGINSNIFTADDTESSLMFFVSPTSQGTRSVKLDNIMLVDLTLMYGEGNEPSAVAQFEEDFRAIFGRDIEYMPYNEGETVRIASLTDGTASVRRIQGQSVVWNQMRENPANEYSYVATEDKTYYGNITSFVYTFLAGHKYYTSLYLERNISENDYVSIQIISGPNVLLGFVKQDGEPDGKVAIISNFTENKTTASLRYNNYPGKHGLSAGDSIYVKNINIIDLTLMFGSGNEPATVEEFEAWLAANVGLCDYYSYDAGTILGVKCTGIKTTGFNQWDEEWELGSIDEANGDKVTITNRIRTKNYNPVLPNTSYYIKQGAGWQITFAFYDKNKNFIGTAKKYNTVYVTPNNAYYFRFCMPQGYGTTYRNDICINISDPNKNGTYEPYFGSTSPMEVVTMKGKLNGQGISTVVFPNGMNSVGDIYDEIYVEDNALKAVKRIGLRDYESADSGNDSIITDGTTTCYELETPQEYVLDPTVDARYFEWYGVKNGAEVKIDTLPCYVSGQGTDTLTIDAMFGENIPVVLRAKRYPWSDSLYPSKAYRNMAWRIPNIDAIVASDRGQAVHSDNDGSYEFDTIINIKKAILDEETKNKHLRFKWWMRNTRNNQAVETSVGWGSQVGIGVEDLRNVRGANNSLASTPVYNEVMLLGAYEEVSYTSGNATEYVTYNGVQLFGRTLE